MPPWSQQVQLYVAQCISVDPGLTKLVLGCQAVIRKTAEVMEDFGRRYIEVSKRRSKW